MLRTLLTGNREKRALLVVGLWLFLTLPAAAQEAMVLSKGLQDLAAQVAANVSKEQKRKVAVLPFQDISGQETVLGSFVAEELITRLFATGNVQIVERSMLDKVLGEVELGGTGLIDPETAQKVGKLAGVDAIVSGSITDLQSFVAINARLIDTETGLLFAAAQVKIVRDDDVKKIIAMPLPRASAGDQATAGSRTNAAGVGNSSAAETASVQRQEAQGFSFELQRCEVSGGSMVCNLLVTSIKIDQELKLNIESRIFDNFGNEIAAQKVQLGDGVADRSHRLYVQKRLISGVPTRLVLEFEGVSQRATKLVALEVILDDYSNERFSVKLRNIQLSR